ncbi:unnamed protein product [Symbiodinium natans]|uniref:Ubiquitin-like domain-containing protein n=1 Tax=Symbiodinium natans TaxID=878477 RepID=A0A812PK40_9DINO|nr:unnamed protein product [Symbiodinium natans]
MVVDPAWTLGQIERPLGIKDLGSLKAAVCTQEQQRRLGVGECGPVAEPTQTGTSSRASTSLRAPDIVAQPAQPVEDLGSWKITPFGYTSEQEARLGRDHHGPHCSHCNGLPVVPPTMTSSLGKALLNSPALLKGLCNMYFRRYDKNRNSTLELREVHTLCDDLHIGLGMTMSGIPPEALKTSIGRFSQDGTDTLSASEFPLWFTETLKESLEAHQRIEEQAAALGFLPLTVKSGHQLARISAPLNLSMHDVIEGVAAVLELPSDKMCLLHGDIQLPSGDTQLAELGLSEQTELTAVVVE